jgi:hypothetical protein
MNKRRKKVEMRKGGRTSRQEGRKKGKRESSKGSQLLSIALKDLREGDRM